MAALMARLAWMSRSRLLRCAVAVTVVLVLSASALVVAVSLPAMLASLGMDFGIYRGFARAWLASGQLYLPAQLSGPYSLETVMGNTYPPTLLWLTVPFATVLPSFLWWAIPAAAIVASLARLRPTRAGWLLLATLVVYPRTWFVVLLGNPALWAYAAIVAGTAWRWPGALAALKPPLAPFALVGWRTRGWWLTAGVIAAASVPFGTLWIDYMRALTNAQSMRGLSYTLGDWPVAGVLLAVGTFLSPGRPVRQRARAAMPPLAAGSNPKSGRHVGSREH